MLVALVAVVGLAKVESPIIERMVAAAGFPHSFVGVVIATLVLLPETLAAVRAARQGRMQISRNLAYGSAMASTGLTIPAIAVASIWIRGPLLLGLGPTQLVLLALTVVVSVLTVVPGRATRLQGEVHLVLLAASFFLAISPSSRWRPAAPGYAALAIASSGGGDPLRPAMPRLRSPRGLSDYAASPMPCRRECPC
ncbi:MAG: Ca2+:H+ antiporter [Mycobacterium sp.]|nr:Ca2+:H+ antiporter [Mycobacterium sp.]